MLLIAFFAGLSEHLALAQSQCTVLDIEWESPEIRCVADGLPNHHDCNTEFYLNGSKKDFEEHFGNPHESSLDIHVTRESELSFPAVLKVLNQPSNQGNKSYCVSLHHRKRIHMYVHVHARSRFDRLPASIVRSDSKLNHVYMHYTYTQNRDRRSPCRRHHYRAARRQRR